MNDAVQYIGANNLQKRDVFYILTENIDLLTWSPGDVVLDIGCGPGDVTANILLPKLPHNVGHIVGGDLSEDMVQHATANFSRPKLSFTQLDIGAQNLDVAKLKSLVGSKESQDREQDGGVFDKIFSFFCLHWVMDQKQAVKNIYALMKPGGEGLVSVVANCPIFDLYETKARQTRWQPYMKDVSHFVSPYHHSPDPRQELVHLLQAEGFQVIHCRTETHRFQFATMNLMKKFITSVNPFVVRIPNDLQEEYVNEFILEISNGQTVRFAYSNNTINGDGKVVMTYDQIVAHFTKCNK